MKVGCSLVALLSLAATALGQTVYVNGACGDDSWSGLSPICAAPNGPKRSIHAAIPAMGDAHISVAPGIYAEQITIMRTPNIPPWAISIESQGGPAVTTIDGMEEPSVLWTQIFSDNDYFCRLDLNGFTIRNAPVGFYKDHRVHSDIRNCVFTNCGLGVEMRGSANVSDCVFHENWSSGLHVEGGGISPATATVDRCVFHHNGLAAIVSIGAVLRLANSLVAFNGGAGVLQDEPALMELDNVTVAANAGPGVHQDSLFAAQVHVHNSIVWGNDSGGTQISGNDPTTLHAEYSIIQGGFGGTANLSSDPLFVDAGAGNFRLSAGSPAIDSGNASLAPAAENTDLDGQPRFQDDPAVANSGQGNPLYLDRGAYEAAGTLPCMGDLNEDQSVDLADLGVLLAEFGTSGSRPGDLNDDGFVDLEDLSILLSEFGAPCR